MLRHVSGRADCRDGKVKTSEVKMAWIQILGLPPSSCETTDKLLNLASLHLSVKWAVVEMRDVGYRTLSPVPGTQ